MVRGTAFTPQAHLSTSRTLQKRRCDVSLHLCLTEVALLGIRWQRGTAPTRCCNTFEATKLHYFIYVASDSKKKYERNSKLALMLSYTLGNYKSSAVAVGKQLYTLN